MKNEEMCISILVKTGLIAYSDDRLMSILGFAENAWIGKRPIEFLYKNDSNLLLTKLCDLTYKIVSDNTHTPHIRLTLKQHFFLTLVRQPFV